MSTPVVTETRRNGNPIRLRPQLPPAASSRRRRNGAANLFRLPSARRSAHFHHPNKEHGCVSRCSTRPLSDIPVTSQQPAATSIVSLTEPPAVRLLLDASVTTPASWALRAEKQMRGRSN
jgi:hypothetical protein